jgi:hypothetical protein
MDDTVRRTAGVLLASLLGSLALGFGLAAAWSTADRLRVLAGYRQTRGKVTRIELDRTGARFAVHRIEVRFRPCPEHAGTRTGGDPFNLPALPRFAEHPGSACDPRGETAPRTVQVPAHGPTTLLPGEHVTVYWHPDHPRDVRVGAFSTFWFTPLVLALLGMLPGGFALRILLDLRAQAAASTLD